MRFGLADVSQVYKEIVNQREWNPEFDEEGTSHMDKRIALITGITGQDGSYLAELLLSKGYEVHGIVRRASTFNTGRLEHLYQDQHEADGNLKLHYGDLSDGTCLSSLIFSIEPDEIYNLGAQSHVRVSFDQPLWPQLT